MFYNITKQISSIGYKTFIICNKNKAKYYCAYQERSHIEVIKKLYSWGLYKADVEDMIVWLIEENYLNEERFAVQFAGGKFKIKQWGRIKIKIALQQHRTSTHNIKTALHNLDETAYQETLQKLATKKWESLKKDTAAIKAMKTTKYLLQKGYESNLIKQAIHKLSGR